MTRHEFFLHVSPDDYLAYYRGEAQHVMVRCLSGLKVQFPASLLQRFVTPEGIHGRFVLTTDEANKCVGLQRVDAP